MPIESVYLYLSYCPPPLSSPNSLGKGSYELECWRIMGEDKGEGGYNFPVPVLDANTLDFTSSSPEQTQRRGARLARRHEWRRWKMPLQMVYPSSLHRRADARRWDTKPPSEAISRRLLCPRILCGGIVPVPRAMSTGGVPVRRNRERGFQSGHLCPQRIHGGFMPTGNEYAQHLSRESGPPVISIHLATITPPP
jgi:hypothetical protein